MGFSVPVQSRWLRREELRNALKGFCRNEPVQITSTKADDADGGDERGVFVDHAMVHRWSIKILPVLPVQECGLILPMQQRILLTWVA